MIQGRVWITDMLKPHCVVCGMIGESEDDTTDFIDMLYESGFLFSSKS
jgi:hypothetical protein